MTNRGGTGFVPIIIGARDVKVFSIIAVAAVIILAPLLAFLVPQITRAAAPPTTIGYQGVLNENGTAVTGSKSMQFDLYTAVTGGTSVWTETQPTVTVTDGFFAVSLGSVTPIPTTVNFNTTSYYLELTVTTTTLSPRQLLDAVPYAKVSFGIQTATTAPTVPAAGGLYYNSTSSTMFVSNGTIWVEVSSGGAASFTSVTNTGTLDQQGNIANSTGDVTIDDNLAVTANNNFTQTGTGTFGTGTGSVSLNGNTTVTGTNTFTVGTGLTTLGGLLTVTGNQTNTADLAVNGGDITTTSTTASLFNTNATTLNIAGAATTLELGAATGTTSINNSLTVDGNTTLGNALTDLVTISGTLQGASPLVFEGATANDFETTLAFTDPTADRTITFPDATGEVSLLGQSIDISSETNLTATTGITLTGDQLTATLGTAIDSSEITDNTILEADLKAVNAATDEQCLTYETTTGDFEWQSCGTGSLASTDIDTSLELLTIVGDETGTGALVFATAPTFTTSITIGAATLTEPELEILDGATLTTAELNFVDGVTSAIQTQLGAKAASGTNADITSLTGLTTDLSVAQGGTGASTFTAGGVLFGNTASAISASGVLTNGQLLIGDNSGAPALATLTGGTNLSVVNAAGTITLNVDDSFLLNNGDTATGIYDFTGATLSGASPFVFEGATADAFETTLAITDPTADRTVTFPDTSGEASLLGQTIANAELVNSAVSFGGVSVSLGASDATPAFDLTDATSLPIATGVSGLATNVATFLGTSTSANLASALTNETGTGLAVFATAPTFTTSITIGAATLTEPELEILDGATLTTAELNFVDGVTSAIQTQLGAKAASGTNADITSLTGLTTDLSVAQGGTGASTFTAGGVLFGNTASAISASGVLANGQLLIGDNSGAPALSTLTGGTNLSVVNAAGSITLNVDDSFLLNNGDTATGTYNFGGATFEIPNSATLPGTCTVGDIYMDTDATSGQRIYACESTDTWVLQGDGSGGGASLSGLTAASASNTIDNLNFAQTWNWSTASTQTALTANANALTSGGILNLASTATAFTGALQTITLSGSNAANTGSLLSIVDSGALNTTTPFKVTGVGAATQTVALIENTGSGTSFRVNDAASDTTPFVIDAAGQVGIGTGSPEGLLSFDATESNTPKIRFQNADAVTGDAALSTFSDTLGVNRHPTLTLYRRAKMTPSFDGIPTNVTGAAKRSAAA